MNFPQFVSAICAFGFLSSLHVESAAPSRSVKNFTSHTHKSKNSVSSHSTTSSHPTTELNNIRESSAGCIPEFISIRLPNDDATIKQYPNCVRINQCGGCCANDLMECQPIKQTPVNVTVSISRRMEGNFYKPGGKREVLVYNHEACACQCKIKKKDCSAKQVYDAARCLCKWSNQSNLFASFKLGSQKSVLVFLALDELWWVMSCSSPKIVPLVLCTFYNRLGKLQVNHKLIIWQIVWLSG